jgi:2-hydroxy-3-oxopropionate reductase
MCNAGIMKTIGFIGLGIMGKPMARNLIRAGYQLYLYDYKGDAIDSFQDPGATLMRSIREVAAASEIIITILPDSPQVKQVALGNDGIIAGLSAGKLYIDMSTIDSASIIEIGHAFKHKWVETLDAPVSGGQAGAENATLSIMVGGNQESFEKALPVFEALGRKISYMGAIGSGQITKSCNQIATALATQGVMEALTFAKKAGVDITKVREALLGGFAQSRVLELTGKKIIDGDFTPGFKIKLYRKDLRIALATASLLKLGLPGTRLLAAEMDTLIAADKGEQDFSALVSLIDHDTDQ